MVDHGTESEPGFSGGAEPEFANKSSAVEFAMGWMGGFVSGIIADEFGYGHFNSLGTAEMSGQAACFAQGLGESGKHQADEDGDNRHHAKQLDQAKAGKGFGASTDFPFHQVIRSSGGRFVTGNLSEGI